MIATFAFKSRTKFSVQFVWDLSTTFRDLNAVTVQLKTGKCLKIKEWLSGLQMPGDTQGKTAGCSRAKVFLLKRNLGTGDAPSPLRVFTPLRGANTGRTQFPFIDGLVAMSDQPIRILCISQLGLGTGYGCIAPLRSLR